MFYRGRIHVRNVPREASTCAPLPEHRVAVRLLPEHRPAVRLPL